MGDRVNHGQLTNVNHPQPPQRPSFNLSHQNTQLESFMKCPSNSLGDAVDIALHEILNSGQDEYQSPQQAEDSCVSPHHFNPCPQSTVLSIITPLQPSAGPSHLSQPFSPTRCYTDVSTPVGQQGAFNYGPFVHRNQLEMPQASTSSYPRNNVAFGTGDTGETSRSGVAGSEHEVSGHKRVSKDNDALRCGDFGTQPTTDNESERMRPYLDDDSLANTWINQLAQPPSASLVSLLPMPRSSGLTFWMPQYEPPSPSLSTNSSESTPPATFVPMERPTRNSPTNWNTSDVSFQGSSPHNTSTSTNASCPPPYSSPSPGNSDCIPGPSGVSGRNPNLQEPTNLNHWFTSNGKHLRPLILHARKAQHKYKLLHAKTGSPLHRFRELYAIDTPRYTQSASQISNWLNVAMKVMDDVLIDVTVESGSRKARSFINPTVSFNSLNAYAMESFDILMRSAKWIAGGAALWHTYTIPHDAIYKAFLSLEDKYFPMNRGMSVVVQGVPSTPPFAVWRFPKYEHHTKGILQFFIKDPRDVDKAYKYLSMFRPTHPQ